MQHQVAEKLALCMYGECMGNRIGRLHRVIARHFDQAIRPLGLSLPQLEVLAVLTLSGAVAPSKIGEALALERSTISRNITLMERNGWITTDSAPSGRTRTVSITAQGTEMLASADAAWADAQARVTELLGPDALGTLDTWLDNLAVQEDQLVHRSTGP